MSSAYRTTPFSECTTSHAYASYLAWCAGQEAAQAVTETTAPLEPAEMEQEQASGEQPAPQLHLAPQAELQQQAGSQVEEAEEATESVADSTAGTAAFSSGGGRYHSVPPSSLWGAPAQVTVSPTAAQPAGAERQQLSSSDSVLEGVADSEHGIQEHSMHRQLPAAESEVQTTDESAEEDAIIAEAEADLARAQRAQREALQAEAAALESSRNALLEVREAMQREQEQSSQSKDPDSSSSKAHTDAVGEQGRDLALVQEADRGADDSMLQTGADVSDQKVPQEWLEGNVLQTDAAMAAAEEAQMESLAEKHPSSEHLRDDVQQESGQPAQSALRHELYFHRHFLILSMPV